MQFRPAAAFSGALGFVQDMLFPPLCPGCRRLVRRPGELCGTCWPQLRFFEKPWCEMLGTPFSHDPGEGAISPAAMANPPPFARARSAVAYEGVARKLVQRLKYGDQPELAPSMAEWMARAGTELIADADVIVPVPLHPRRYFSRRFNQSAELGRALAKQTGLPFEPDAVIRRKLTRQQVGLGLSERKDNVRGAFAVPKGAESRISGRRVLLIDDVFTTGATVEAVTRSLLRKGARAVDVLTFARALSGDATEM